MPSVRVLIAEDNELVALTLEEQLASLGYEVAGVARRYRSYAHVWRTSA